MSDVRIEDGEIWDKRPKKCARCEGTTGGVVARMDMDTARYYCEHHRPIRPGVFVVRVTSDGNDEGNHGAYSSEALAHKYIASCERWTGRYFDIVRYEVDPHV